MSEQLPVNQERREQQPSPEDGRQQEKLKELLKKAEQAPDTQKERLPEIEQQAKEEAVSGKEYTIGEHDADKQPADARINSDLKRMSFQRVVGRLQNRLPWPEKALSKAIHQPVVDKISSIGEKTVARPSGLLGGGICAFVGSSVFLWAAKHYGFTYNYLLFFLFFVGGFVLGMIIELCIHALRRKQV
jgi:hypothetical protein